MFRAGQQIGSYTLVQKIGRGGFGEVWLAERRAKFVTTKVAVKLPLEEQVDTDAIRQEAVLWEQASGHPNVLPIIDADEYDGQIVIVSEYAPEGSLDEVLKKENALPIRKAVELTVGVLSGLEFLHSRKIIHRDIKPANVLLQGDTPRLADFGISRVMRTTSQSATLTGTPSYMAPEAFDRKRSVQTDVWSVGVILYQMLKGELPFPQENLTDLLGAIVRNEPEPLPASVPSALERIVMKALAKEQNHRYQSAIEMREDLTAFLARISQRDIQLTQAVIPTDPLTNAPTLAIPVVPETKEPVSVAGQQSQQIDGVPQSAARKSPSRVKFLIPVVALLLLAGGLFGGYLLFRDDSKNVAKDSNSPVSSGNTKLIPFRKGNKFGFADADKKMVVDAKYDAVGPFSDGLAVVATGAFNSDYNFYGKHGYIDKSGKEIVPLKYDGACPRFTEGRSWVALNGKWGFIDNTGKEIIPLKYDGVGEFSEGMAQVVLGGKYGYIDKNGVEVIPPKYVKATPFSEGLANVSSEERGTAWAIWIDKTGKELSSLSGKYMADGNFSEDLASVSLYVTSGGLTDVKLIYINKEGKTVLSPKGISKAGDFKDGLAGVQDKNTGKIGFIDKTGNVVIPMKYDTVFFNFENGLTAASINGKAGYINKSGEVVIPFKYDAVAFQFVEGYSLVKSGDKLFYIDKQGVEYYEP